MLELGTALGYTALWFAHGAPDAIVDTVERDPVNIGDAVGAPAHHHGSASYRRAIIRIRATVENYFISPCDKNTVSRCAGFHMNARRMPRTHGLEILVLGKGCFHRASCRGGQCSGDGLYRCFHLPAKPAADPRRDRPHLRHRQAKSLGNVRLHPINRLVGGPHRETPVGIYFRQC